MSIRPPLCAANVACMLAATDQSRTPGLVTHAPKRMLVVCSMHSAIVTKHSRQMMWESKNHAYVKPACSACLHNATVRFGSISPLNVIANSIGFLLYNLLDCITNIRVRGKVHSFHHDLADEQTIVRGINTKSFQRGEVIQAHVNREGARRIRYPNRYAFINGKTGHPRRTEQHIAHGSVISCNTISLCIYNMDK